MFQLHERDTGNSQWIGRSQFLSQIFFWFEFQDKN